VPIGVNFVQETTVFREFGPLAGNTMRLSYEIAPKIGNTLSRQTADVDARYYQRLGASGVLALRGSAASRAGASSRLHLLRRQLRDARLRLPAFVGSTAASRTPSCASRSSRRCSRRSA
jgi:hypothetical protein